MALSLGKKKKEVAETDWSEDALLDDAAPADVEPAAATPFDHAAPKEKPLLKIVLPLVLLLVLGGGAAAYFLMSSAPEEEAPLIVAQRPGKPDNMRPDPSSVKPTIPQKPVVAGKPAQPGKPLKPEPRGFRPADDKKLAFQSPGPSAPHLAPGSMVPTPVQPPTGLAGTPGRYGSRNVQIVPVGGAPALDAELQAQLDALWQKGADAKHGGDYAGARQAWQQILQLSPAHPGIQDAINKLPK